MAVNWRETMTRSILTPNKERFIDRSAEKPTDQKIIDPGDSGAYGRRPRRAVYTIDHCERDGYTGPNICICGINVIIDIVGQIYDNDGRWFDMSRARLLARGSTPYTPVNIAWYCSRRPVAVADRQRGFWKFIPGVIPASECRYL